MSDNDYGNYVLRMDKTCYWHAYINRFFLSYSSNECQKLFPPEIAGVHSQSHFI